MTGDPYSKRGNALTTDVSQIWQKAGCDPHQSSRNKINAKGFQRSKRLLCLAAVSQSWHEPLRSFTPGTDLTLFLNPFWEHTFLNFSEKEKKKKTTWQPCWKSCTCQANNTWINTHQVLTSCPFREQSQELLRTPPLSSAPILIGREAPVFTGHIWKRGKWSTWEL